MTENPMNRRDFLKGVTLSSLGLTLAAEELTARAQAQPAAQAGAAAKVDDELKGAPVNCAVIGISARGREILGALAKMGPYAPVVTVCDTFAAPVFVKKAQAIAAKAAFEADYRKVLDDKNVQAVFIATPSHKHKQIALDAIAAGKNVYCEAPLATDLAEAKAIAQAAMAAKTIFQPGLQQRCNLQSAHVYDFVESGALGKMVGGRAQHHERRSWKQPWPTPEREAELNWRLHRDTSTGLVGEIGIHQIDIATWYYKALPLSVVGFGGVLEYNDGRDVPDTVQCIVEYPGNVRYVYDATLSNTFDDEYELFLGSSCAIILRDQRGWMFKEADSNLIGWEGFARKDILQIGKPENGSGLNLGTGIALVADASKQLALGKTELVNDPTKTALYQACRAFLASVRAGQRAPLKEPTKENPHPPIAPGPLEGYQATVVAAKINEAVLSGSKIVFEKEWFTL